MPRQRGTRFATELHFEFSGSDKMIDVSAGRNRPEDCNSQNRKLRNRPRGMPSDQIKRVHSSPGTLVGAHHHSIIMSIVDMSP